MTWNDDDLMAHADDELAGERRAALIEAMAHDPQLRARVAAFEAQRQRVSTAFAEVLDEPVPDRLAALLAVPAPVPAAEKAPAPVVDLADRRARREPRRIGGMSWAQWGGMAASVCLGIALGVRFGSPAGTDTALVRDVGGRMVASGALDQALTSQVIGAPATGVAVPVTFVDRDGRYCRAFNAERLAGLACRDAAAWTLETTVAVTPATGTGMRQASSALPREVLEAVDGRIAGQALSAEHEQAAKVSGWKR